MPSTSTQRESELGCWGCEGGKLFEKRGEFAPVTPGTSGDFDAAQYDQKQCGESETVMHVSLDSWIGSYSGLAIQ